MGDKTRFDLEQEIQGCWSITDDIGVLLNAIDDPKFSEDDQMNFLIGLKTIYDAKFGQLLKTYEHLVNEGKIQ